MTAERSNSSTRVRRHASRIFKLPVEEYSNADWRFENCRVLTGWTETNSGDGVEGFYSPFAPILYGNHENGLDRKKLFLNECVMDVSALGPFSIFRFANKSYAGLWHYSFRPWLFGPKESFQS